MLNEIAEQQLRKAGWYPGRKIDRSENKTFPGISHKIWKQQKLQ